VELIGLSNTDPINILEQACRWNGKQKNK
jgi:hypothetical protein